MTGAPVPRRRGRRGDGGVCPARGDRISTDSRFARRRRIQPARLGSHSGRCRGCQRGQRARFHVDRSAGHRRTHHRQPCTGSPLWRFSPRATRSSRSANSPRFQVRNSNACSLAVQVARAGGCPEILPVARDNYDSTRRIVETRSGLRPATAFRWSVGGQVRHRRNGAGRLGAEFYFDRVRVQPGQPLVFGQRPRDVLFWIARKSGLDDGDVRGVRASRAGIARGTGGPVAAVANARLAEPFRQKPGLDAVPSRHSRRGRDVDAGSWSGSSDVPSLARANAFLVTDPDSEATGGGDGFACF